MRKRKPEKIDGLTFRQAILAADRITLIGPCGTIDITKKQAQALRKQNDWKHENHWDGRSCFWNLRGGEWLKMALAY